MMSYGLEGEVTQPHLSRSHTPSVQDYRSDVSVSSLQAAEHPSGLESSLTVQDYFASLNHNFEIPAYYCSYTSCLSAVSVDFKSEANLRQHYLESHPKGLDESPAARLDYKGTPQRDVQNITEAADRQDHFIGSTAETTIDPLPPAVFFPTRSTQPRFTALNTRTEMVQDSLLRSRILTEPAGERRRLVQWRYTNFEGVPKTAGEDERKPMSQEVAQERPYVSATTRHEIETRNDTEGPNSISTPPPEDDSDFPSYENCVGHNEPVISGPRPAWFNLRSHEDSDYPTPRHSIQ